MQILISFQMRYSISKVVRIIKSISGSKILKEYERVKKKLWGVHF
jgi:hypothetical protein